MKAYLYLARRDKKGIKIVAILEHRNVLYSRVKSVSDLFLHSTLERPIEKIFYEHRMQWEPWIETVDSYNELIRRLRSRGFTEIPVRSTPLVSKIHISNKVRGIGFEAPKTMIRRGVLRRANEVPGNNKRT